MILGFILGIVIMTIGFMISKEFDEPFYWIPIGVSAILAILAVNECVKLIG